MREWKAVTVTKKAENSIKEGHLWVYGTEIVSASQTPENGEIVDVYSQKDRYLGSGFYNNVSKIAVRILSDNANDRFDAAFFARRVSYAIDYRRTVMAGDLSCTRLIFGDADGLPGVIADKFENVLVTQIMSLGADLRREQIYAALIERLRALGETVDVLYERSDVQVRKKEGLELYKGYFAYPGLRTADNDGGTVTIEENGVKYIVDYVNGQKTGFFLDQKLNRLAAARLAAGKRVLDCFTHTGAFALNCAAAGAKSVTAVDVSAEAIRRAKENAALNGAHTVDFLAADVFDYLTELEKSGRRPYDMIILDPPAFTKSSATVRAAFSGYKEINLKAMKLLPRGGYLATCSCSHFMTDELFRKMLKEASADAGVRLKIIETRRQAPDHPVLCGVDETEYLKFYTLQIV